MHCNPLLIYIVMMAKAVFTEGGLDNICTLPRANNRRERVSLPGGKGQVLCDTVTDGGGWIVIQRRVKGDVLFNRTWDTYTKGFGFVEGDFWIGLENIHRLCPTNCSLRAEIAYKGKDYFSQHRDFSLSDAADKYRLRLGGLVAGNTAEDDLLHYSILSTVNQQPFSTWDADHDNCDGNCPFKDIHNCASDHGGAGWWWNGCGMVNPNGRWASKSYPTAMFWASVTGSQSATSTELKLRVGPGADWSRVDTRPITGAGVTPVDREPSTTPVVTRDTSTTTTATTSPVATTATTTTTTIEFTAAAVATSTPPSEPTVTEAANKTIEAHTIRHGAVWQQSITNGAQCTILSLTGLALCVMAAGLLILA